MAHKTIDLPFRDWKQYPRRFPFYLQVATSNFLQGKTYKVYRRVILPSYSFLFRGRGELHSKGEVYLIEAPCLMLRRPGEYQEYGPLRPEDAWDELYFTYDPFYANILEKTGFTDPQAIVRPMNNPGGVWLLAEELASLVNETSPEDSVDLVDRICERMIIEAFRPMPDAQPAQQIIKRIQAHLRKAPQQPFDISETARQYGMSEATFRRRWAEVVNEPPRSYIETLRLEEACRLLVGTNRSIKEIAHGLGFEDELYFSKRFQIRKGLSPRCYRERHRA